MSTYGGAFKDLQEWKEISAIVTALAAGTTPPAMTTAFREWRDLGVALADLAGGSIGISVVDNNGDAILDNSGASLSL